MRGLGGVGFWLGLGWVGFELVRSCGWEGGSGWASAWVKGAN